jgi:hypothetical protein
MMLLTTTEHWNIYANRSHSWMRRIVRIEGISRLEIENCKIMGDNSENLAQGSE